MSTAKDQYIRSLEADLKAEKGKDHPNPRIVRELEAKIRQLKASVLK